MIKSRVDVEDVVPEFLGLETTLALQLKELEQRSFLPTFERQEAFTLGEDGEERVFLDTTENQRENIQGVKLASLGTQYFAQSIMDHSDIVPDFQFMSNSEKRSSMGGFVIRL